MAKGLLGIVHGFHKRRDCPQGRLHGKPYCYYHDKLLDGLMEPESTDPYPVWPLPATGYLPISREAAA